ncbi:Response regulator receiver domain-containing protein [Lachnospiraceae bacterium XBB2008]|nr:Response regulator receiver domain-containing protein [Lachnospiraceae bacterium XBB2008]
MYDFDEKRNIVIACRSKGYLVSNLIDQFDKEAYNLIRVTNVATMNTITDHIDACLLYLDEELLEDSQLLIFIRDKATEEDFPLFVLGDPQEISSVKDIITANLVGQTFERPINIKDVVNDIHKYLLEHTGVQRKIILAVDDSGVMLNSIKNWLGDKYQVLLADSGLTAVKSITITRPDLIILDYEMPVVDGKQVLEMIRSERDFADIPVIFLTGRQDKESIIDVMALKPEGYLLKTMKPYAVRQYIDEFFIKRDAQLKGNLLRKSGK